MKVSTNWIRQYLNTELPPTDELVERIGAQLGAVEEVADFSKKYAGAVIVRVVECGPLENSDHLNLCFIDDNGVVQGVTRREDGLVQVVCGAPNVKAGMSAVWLPPGATVPSTYDKEPFVLEARELRGAVSNGMLASPKELALGDSHEGLLVIDPEEWSPTGQSIEPGTDFAAAFGLNDVIIDIENKMFTHRPDCFGQLGVAREVAGILHQPFKSPDWYANKPAFTDGGGLELTVRNDAKDLVPRLMAVALKGVTIKPSPVWLQAQLTSVGVRSINNIVDVTNYIMLLTGQPTHAYDYDKLRGHQLVARAAAQGESAALLNGKTYQLDATDIAIADADGVIGLGGIMGGGNSEVSSATTNIVLECANFDMYTVRRSSMRHGLFTDAVTRFSKGQSPLQNDHVLQLLIQSVIDVAGGEVASPIYDEHDGLPAPAAVRADADFINSRLGLTLNAAEMSQLLTNVEFQVEHDDKTLQITAPFWRTDIGIAEDIVEEVGRLHGFDKLPLALPRRDITPAPEDPLLQLKTDIRTSLVRAGANELLTYSFVHRDLLEKAAQNPEQAYQVSNALSPDLQFYRLTALPSLLDKVHPNIKAGYDEFALFELGKGHDKSADLNSEGVPFEFEDLDFVYASKMAKPGAAFYHARRYLDALASDLGVELTFLPFDDVPVDPVSDPYDPGRLTEVRAGDVHLGVVGEFKASVVRNFKLPSYSAGFTISPGRLLKVARRHEYQPLPRYPKIEQDICLKVPAEVTFADLHALVQEYLEAQKPANTVLHLAPLDMYQRQDDTSHKQVTFRVGLASFEKTMTDKEMTGLLDGLAAAAAAKIGAERV